MNDMKFTKNLNEFKDSKFDIIYQLHIPKTSGTSISGKKWTKGPAAAHTFNVDFSSKFGHKSIARQHKLYMKNPQYHPQQKYPNKNNIKVAILRNPFDLLCSYYHHGKALAAKKKQCHSGWASVNYIHQFHTFEEFIQGYCDKQFKWHQPMFKQFLFSQLFNKEGDCVPDILLKYEYLDDSIQVMNKTWGLDLVRSSDTNVSWRKKHNYTFYYTDKLFELVSEKCKKELQIFKYDFRNIIDDSYFIIPKNLKFHLEREINENKK